MRFLSKEELESFKEVIDFLEKFASSKGNFKFLGIFDNESIDKINSRPAIIFRSYIERFETSLQEYIIVFRFFDYGLRLVIDFISDNRSAKLLKNFYQEEFKESYFNRLNLKEFFSGNYHELSLRNLSQPFYISFGALLKNGSGFFCSSKVKSDISDIFFEKQESLANYFLFNCGYDLPEGMSEVVINGNKYLEDVFDFLYYQHSFGGFYNKLRDKLRIKDRSLAMPLMLMYFRDYMHRNETSLEETMDMVSRDFFEK